MTPSAWRPFEIAPGPPAMLIGAWRTRGCRVSDEGFLVRNLDVEGREREPCALLQLRGRVAGDQDVAEPVRPGAKGREHTALRPVETRLVHPVQRKRGRGVELDDPARRSDEEADLPVGRDGRTASEQVVGSAFPARP